MLASVWIWNRSQGSVIQHGDVWAADPGELCGSHQEPARSLGARQGRPVQRPPQRIFSGGLLSEGV
jgi:hypothetical protein